MPGSRPRPARSRMRIGSVIRREPASSTPDVSGAPRFANGKTTSLVLVKSARGFHPSAGAGELSFRASEDRRNRQQGCEHPGGSLPVIVRTAGILALRRGHLDGPLARPFHLLMRREADAPRNVR